MVLTVLHIRKLSPCCVHAFLKKERRSLHVHGYTRALFQARLLHPPCSNHSCHPGDPESCCPARRCCFNFCCCKGCVKVENAVRLRELASIRTLPGSCSLSTNCASDQQLSTVPSDIKVCHRGTEANVGYRNEGSQALRSWLYSPEFGLAVLLP